MPLNVEPPFEGAVVLLDEGTNQKKWVMIVTINPGAPLRGSINEYSVGNFDGMKFTPDDNVARLMDFGKP